MGSFAFTCAVSNLPIECGDEVRWILLVKNQYFDGSIHTTRSEWIPKAPPIRAVYDDYGSIEAHDENSLIGQAIMKLVPPTLVGQGAADGSRRPKTFEELLSLVRPNDRSGAEVFEPNRAQYNIDAFESEYRTQYGDAFAEGLRQLRQACSGVFEEPKRLPLRQALIREDVWQALLSAYSSRKERAKEYADARKLFDYHVRLNEQARSGDLRCLQALLDLGTLGTVLEPQLQAREISESFANRTIVRHDYYGFSPGAPKLSEHWRAMARMQAMQPRSSRQVDRAVRDTVELLMVEQAMGYLRCAWHPGQSVGTQFGEWKMHAKFHRRLAEISLRQARRLQ